MDLHDFDWIGAATLFLAFWARLEHRLTKLEVRLDNCQVIHKIHR